MPISFSPFLVFFLAKLKPQKYRSYHFFRPYTYRWFSAPLTHYSLEKYQLNHNLNQEAEAWSLVGFKLSLNSQGRLYVVIYRTKTTLLGLRFRATIYPHSINWSAAFLSTKFDFPIASVTYKLGFVEKIVPPMKVLSRIGYSFEFLVPCLFICANNSTSALQ